MNAYQSGGENLLQHNVAVTSVYLLTAHPPLNAPASVNTEANTEENQTFAFRGQNVRTVTHNGEPWFVAKDVCDVLGIGNPSDAVAALDADERGSLAITDGTSPKGGNPNHTIISESGLYALIFKSRKPEAKAFRKWVTSEVLPILRKTGSYAMPKAPEPAPCKTWGKDNLPTAANDGRRESILPDSKNRPIPCVHQTAQIMPVFLNDFPAQIDGVIFGVIHFFGILAKPSIHVHSCVHL